MIGCIIRNLMIGVWIGEDWICEDRAGGYIDTIPVQPWDPSSVIHRDAWESPMFNFWYDIQRHDTDITWVEVQYEHLWSIQCDRDVQSHPLEMAPKYPDQCLRVPMHLNLGSSVLNNRPEVTGTPWLLIDVATRDDLSGACKARSIKDGKLQTVADFFWEQIICQYGAVRQVVTDNRPENQLNFKNLMIDLGVPHITISRYNSQGNGLVERGHFTLREALVKSCEGNLEE
jgi:hypothetical protein